MHDPLTHIEYFTEKFFELKVSSWQMWIPKFKNFIAGFALSLFRISASFEVIEQNSFNNSSLASRKTWDRMKGWVYYGIWLKGTCNNHMDRILGNFDPLPSLWTLFINISTWVLKSSMQPPTLPLVCPRGLYTAPPKWE